MYIRTLLVALLHCIRTFRCFRFIFFFLLFTVVFYIHVRTCKWVFVYIYMYMLVLPEQQSRMMECIYMYMYMIYYYMCIYVHYWKHCCIIMCVHDVHVQVHVCWSSPEWQSRNTCSYTCTCIVERIKGMLPFYCIFIIYVHVYDMKRKGYKVYSLPIPDTWILNTLFYSGSCYQCLVRMLN